jgi:disulfide bond formation protein DsbB
MDVIQLLSVLTLFSNFFVVVVIGAFVLHRFFRVSRPWKKITAKIGSYSILAALIVSLTATLGSLYLSESRGFEPCKLCWIQRIFMYPIPILLGVSMYKNLKDVYYYVLPLAGVGAVIAAYHYYFQVSGNPLIPCSTVGFSVSCSERFFTYYGYITIPWMALTAFLLIVVFVGLSRNVRNNR